MNVIFNPRFLILLTAFCLSLGCGQKEILGEGKVYKVTKIIDGDTIEIEGGERIRYIGIDTPERMMRKNDRWIYRPMPFAEESKAYNKKLVLGKKVRLEMDIEPRDRYGRVLAYVFLDEILVNEELIRQGYAHLLTIPPNVKYVEHFKKALKEAKKEKRGLWSD
jgi:micrococcal nuclease